jgi:5-methylthioadenosine/S-adenosylhomocysteine deaminase
MAMGQKQRTLNAENMSIPQALTIATKEAAKVYGQPDRLGDLAPGKLADIILIDLGGVHHQPLYSVTASLVYNLRGGDVRTVIVDGRVIMRDRELLTIDKAAVIEHVRQQMPRLSHRPADKRIQTYNP